MAALIGDVFTDSSRFHNMIAGPGLQHQHSQDSHSHYQSSRSVVSRSKDRDVPAHSPRRQSSATSASARYTSQASRDWEAGDKQESKKAESAATAQDSSTHGGASRLPTPPLSSSSSTVAQPQHGTPAYATSADPLETETATSSTATKTGSQTSTYTTITATAATPSRVIPSPESDTAPQWKPLGADQFTRPAAKVEMEEAPRQTIIHIRDLAHIQSLARADMLAGNGAGLLAERPLQEKKYEISGMPIGDIIEMVAAILTKITTSNDSGHKAQHRNAAHLKQIQAQAKGGEVGSENTMSPLASSVLAFHGKNVPAITILSYLSRIHKYCPTTYEVFLSLLVYFDRMSERVNHIILEDEKERKAQQEKARTRAESSASRPSINPPNPDADTVMRDDESEESDESDSDLADDDDEVQSDDGPAPSHTSASAPAQPATASNPVPNAAVPSPDPAYFVVDSFNIHRLIIAGVTCASKFFSDVFYTNSRYAKVGGLPLAELNHLELQFLLLNDFRLAVPVEDLEAYATMLVEFYAREVVSHRSRSAGGMD